MAFDVFRADPFFGDEFYRGAEEVVEEPPFLGIETIKQGNDVDILEAVIA